MNALKQFLAALNNPFGMKLSGNELLVLLRINNEMNTAHWTETLPLADSSLLALLNQYDSTGKPMSLESLRRIKQKLKGKGLIDFTGGKGSQISEYRLVKLYTDEPCPHPDNTPADTPDNTPDKLLNNNSNNNSPENVKIEKLKEKEKNAHTRTSNSDEDIEEDVRAGYFGLSLEAKLQEKYGVEKLEKAMDKALGYNNAGLNHLERTLEELTAEHKGEMKNGRSGRNGNNVTAKNRRNAWDD